MSPFSRVWADRQPRACLVAFAGIGGHSGDFTAWGEVLSGRGIALAAQDYHGFGVRRDEPLTGRDGFVQEVDVAIEAARDRFRDVPVVTAGESLGSLVVLEHASRGRVPADGLLLSAPAIRTPRKLPPARVALMMFRLAIGSDKPLNFTGKVENLSVDAKEVEDLLADTRRRLTVPARFLYDVWCLQRSALSHARGVKVPTLILWGEYDRVASFPETRSLLSIIPADLRRLEIIPGERHMLTRGARRRWTGEMIADWIVTEIIGERPEQEPAVLSRGSIGRR